MAIVRKAYALSVDRFKKPKVYTDKEARAVMLMRLLIMEPNTDPLHPDMGVGIRMFRYSMNTLSDLSKRIQDQITTYLPDLSDASVKILVNPDHTCNVHIIIGDDVYLYDSNTAPVPITLSDIVE